MAQQRGPEGDGVTTLAQAGRSASLLLADQSGAITIRLDAAMAALFLGGAGQSGRTIWMGERGVVHTLDGASGAAFIGGAGLAGSVQVRDQDGTSTVSLDGRAGAVVAGTLGMPGDLVARDPQARPAVLLDGGAATVQAGVRGHAGQVRVILEDGEPAVILGERGAQLAGSGLAEGFVTSAPPGAVVVTSGTDTLEPCTRQADRRVVGVVADAPAVSLGEGRLTRPVVVCGRARCRVDADLGAIQPGDLLVSAPTPGHAMRADDAPTGALLGKSLQALDHGQETILVLITLG